MEHNLWSGLFLISIAQGVFVLFLLLRRPKWNHSTYFLAVLLSLMIITNLDFYVVSSGVYRLLPHFFGMSLGIMFLFGPLLFFYTRSLTDSNFTWKRVLWVHFLPYLINLAFNAPFLSVDSVTKISFIQYYVENGVPLRMQDKVFVSLQSIHLWIYLVLTFRLIKVSKLRFGNIQYVTSVAQRLEWARKILISFAAFGLIVVLLLAYVLFSSALSVEVNYLYTVVASCIIYFIAFRATTNPELIAPNFLKKYRTSGELKVEELNAYVLKLEELMRSKVYMNPRIRLEDIAKQLGLHQNRLSRLINEKYGKSYADFINECRINEFMAKVKANEHKMYNIYGLATEVGFKSKSSFNVAFKKVTGKTPSEFKRGEN